MLKFDTKRLYKDFLDAIDKELDIVAQHAVEYMVSEIAKLPTSGSHSSVGASEWRAEVMQAIKYDGVRTATGVLKRVGILDQNDELLLNRALLINYGMGQTLSRQNPYLQEYEKSPYFKSPRPDYRVFTRPGETVYDYETGTWYTSRAKVFREIEPFYQLPSYFFENAMKFIQDEYNRAIKKVFDTFDFAPYLISDA